MPPSQSRSPCGPQTTGAAKRTTTAARFTGTSVAPAAGSSNVAPAEARAGDPTPAGRMSGSDRYPARTPLPAPRAPTSNTKQSTHARVVGHGLRAVAAAHRSLICMVEAPQMAEADLILASASPRRRELLERMGLALEIRPPNVDETPLPGERPADYVRRIAAAKCDAVADGGAPRRRPPDLAVLGADTIVIVGPADPGQAGRRRTTRARMLAALAGRRHDVTTAYRIRFGGKTRRARGDDRRLVPLAAARPSSTPTSRPANGGARPAATPCKGIAGAFVTELRGSHTNVIGLPLAEVLADLQALEALPRYPRAGFGAR